MPLDANMLSMPPSMSRVSVVMLRPGLRASTYSLWTQLYCGSAEIVCRLPVYVLSDIGV